MKLTLPPRELLVKTNEEDPLLFYFLPGAKYIFRKRLVNTLAVLDEGGKKFGSLLEIAFGSGILLPELAKRTKALFGMDSHSMIPEVRKMLDAMGIKAELNDGSLFKMPYADGLFDAIVAVSVLEHFKDLAPAMREIDRVLAKDGTVVLSFPTRNILTDLALRAWGDDPLSRHPSSHRDVIAAAERVFQVERALWLPSFVPMDLTLYCSIRCRKR